MWNVFTCTNCGKYLECYVGTGYGKPYKNIQGCFEVDLCTVIDEMKARAYTKNSRSIATLLSCTSIEEDDIHDWA